MTPGSLGFSATAGEVDVALQSGHYGIEVKDLNASLVGVPAITFDVEHLDATVNPDAMDWHTARLVAVDGRLGHAGCLRRRRRSRSASFVSVAGGFSLTESGRCWWRR